MIYAVEFPDGQVKDYVVNAIAENMLSQVDDKLYSATIVDLIVDYNRDDSSV